MPKRKRDSDEGGGAARPHDGAKQQRVAFKLKQGTAKLGHAFKVAKGFERQKLGRRKKNAGAQKNAKDLQRIDAEIAALKTLDNSACARTHLYKTLSKIKAVAQSPSLPAEVLKPATLSTETAALNVHARLCDSNPVKEASQATLKDISQALGVKVAAEDGPKKRLRAKDYEQAADAKKQSRTESGSEDEFADEDGEDSERSTHRRVIGSDEDGSEDELAGFDARLASSDDEEDSRDDNEGDESDLDVEELERRLETEGIARRATKPFKPTYDHVADLDLTTSGAESHSASASPEPRKAAKTSRPKGSAFLPSLSMGGYISGSEGSEASDIDEAPKKNRRGQRARQQIYEKKYGSKANHLQKDQRKEGWDPKRGATEVGRGGRGGRGGRRFGVTGRSRGGGHGQSLQRATGGDGGKQKHRDDGGSIHPSWEAAKKAKERKESVPAFAGRKTVFS